MASPIYPSFLSSLKHYITEIHAESSAYLNAPEPSPQDGSSETNPLLHAGAKNKFSSKPKIKAKINFTSSLYASRISLEKSDVFANQLYQNKGMFTDPSFSISTIFTSNLVNKVSEVIQLFHEVQIAAHYQNVRRIHIIGLLTLQILILGLSKSYLKINTKPFELPLLGFTSTVFVINYIYDAYQETKIKNLYIQTLALSKEIIENFLNLENVFSINERAEDSRIK